jgi:DNA polymerase-3 subunit delta
VKLGGAEARAHLRRPDPRFAATLLSGDEGRVAEARRSLLLGLAGPGAEAEVRLARLGGAELRRDPALLPDAVKARGFFPGPRVVWVEEATDGCAPALAAALAGWAEGDARILLTAGTLPARGALRTLAERDARIAAVALYDDPPTAADMLDLAREAGLGTLDPAAREEILALAQGLSPGELRDLLGRLALYHHGEPGPLPAASVRDLAPLGDGAEIDELLAAVTDRARARVGPLLDRVLAGGSGPVAVAIAAGRHFRALLAVVADPGGPQAGIGRLRPPASGARRQALLRAAAAWRADQVEEALAALLALDLRLRSGIEAPAAALLGRTLLRLASAGRGG